MVRATSAASTATRPRPCVTPKRAWRRSAMELLADIDKDTVDFADNFDGTLQEPTVLPSSLSRICWSTARRGSPWACPPASRRTTWAKCATRWSICCTNWETLDDIGVPELMQFIKGPDFPTGGAGLSRRRLTARSGYEDQAARGLCDGRGKLTVRAKAHIEELGARRSRIIISEIPYQTNKTSLIERIAELVRDGTDRGHQRSARRERPHRACAS